MWIFMRIMVNLAQARAMPHLGSSLACYQFFRPLLCGANLKNATFMVSQRMWCQLLGRDQCYGTFSEPNMCLESKLEIRKWNVRGRHTSYTACDNTTETLCVKYGINYRVSGSKVSGDQALSRQNISVSEWIIKRVGHWSPNAYVHHFLLLLVELPIWTEILEFC